MYHLYQGLLVKMCFYAFNNEHYPVYGMLMHCLYVCVYKTATAEYPPQKSYCMYIHNHTGNSYVASNNWVIQMKAPYLKLGKRYEKSELAILVYNIMVRKYYLLSKFPDM